MECDFRLPRFTSEAILGYPRSNLKRHWTELHWIMGKLQQKGLWQPKNTKGLHSQRCSDWLSPPSSGWPQVTTRPSAKIAANAKWVLSSLQTSLSKCWTRWLSPPIASLWTRPELQGSTKTEPAISQINSLPTSSIPADYREHHHHKPKNKWKQQQI